MHFEIKTKHKSFVLRIHEHVKNNRFDAEEQFGITQVPRAQSQPVMQLLPASQSVSQSLSARYDILYTS